MATHDSASGAETGCSLVLREFVDGVSSGVGGTAQEIGDQFEVGVSVSGADLVHPGVHPRKEPVHLGVAAA
jgi:hypothetical protein